MPNGQSLVEMHSKKVGGVSCFVQQTQYENLKMCWQNCNEFVSSHCNWKILK